MQSFMKTIISALQTWVNKRIKSNTPDWNQNDSNGDGYIKNRPFYEYEGKVVIAPKTTISSDNSESNLTEPLVVGNTYTVIFDGVDYECVCREYDGYYMLGNNAIYEYDNGVTTDTGEPFAVEANGNDTSLWWYLPEGDTMEHIVSISGLSTTVKKMDAKYLPNAETYAPDIAEYLPENILRPDYEIYDATQFGYIKNRPCYYQKFSYVNSEKITLSASSSKYIEWPIKLVRGESYIVKGRLRFDGSAEAGVADFETTVTCNSSGRLTPAIAVKGSDPNRINTVTLDYIYSEDADSEYYRGKFSVNGGYTVGRYISPGNLELNVIALKQIDEVMIPDSIARAKEVPIVDNTLSIEGAAADAKAVGIALSNAKNYVSLIDEVNGYPYIVSMRDGNLVSTIGVKSIKVTTMPTTTEYMHGAYFDATGIVVTATCYDGTTKDVTNDVYVDGYLMEGMTSAEIIYMEAGISHTAAVPVTVSAFDPAVVLVDFTYTDNGNGTYTITGWNGTYNGETSTEMIIPNYGCIIV